MRPISFFSAALCGVLCALSIPFTGAIDTLVHREDVGAKAPICALGDLLCSSTSITTSTSDAPALSTPNTLSVASTSAIAPTPTPSSTPSPSQHTETGGSIETGQSTAQPTSSPTVAGKSNTGVVVGGIIGGLLGVALILGVVGFFFWRRRRQSAASAGDFGTLEKNLVSSSPPVYTIPGTAYSPPPLQPQQSPAPPITAVESHHLMGSYSGSGGVPPVGVAGYASAPGYAADNQREREVDEDGISLRSPSPVQDGGRAGERDSVPRLPIYNRGTGNADRGPAL